MQTRELGCLRHVWGPENMLWKVLTGLVFSVRRSALGWTSVRSENLWTSHSDHSAWVRRAWSSYPILDLKTDEEGCWGGQDRQAAHRGAGAPRGTPSRAFDRSCRLAWERGQPLPFGGCSSVIAPWWACRPEIPACSNSGCDRHPIFSSPHAIQTFLILSVEILDKSVLFWISTVIYVIYYLAREIFFFLTRRLIFLKNPFGRSFPCQESSFEDQDLEKKKSLPK